MAKLDLGKQVGPLPLGGWLAAGAAGIGLAYAVNRKRSAATIAAEDAAATAQTPNPAETAGLGGGIGTGGVVQLAQGASGAQPAGGGGGTSTLSPTFTDNDAWSAYATSLLVAKGYNGLTITKALSDYMQGQQLDAQEQAIIDLAIRSAGPPPVAVPPVVLAPAPTPAPTSTPTGMPAGYSQAVRTNYRDGALHTFYTAPGVTLPGYSGSGSHLFHEWVFADGVPHHQDLSVLLHLGPIIPGSVPVVNGNGPDGFLHVDIVGIDGKHNDVYWNGRAWVQRVLTP